MLWGFSLAMFVSYMVNMIVVGKRLGYSTIQHLKDILPYAAISIVMAFITLLIGKLEVSIFTNGIYNLALILIIQILAAMSFYLGVSFVLGSKVIKESIELITSINKHS